MSVNNLIACCLFISACGSPQGIEEKADEPPEDYQDYLLYISNRGQGFDIYRFDSLSGEVKLTNNPGWDWSPQPTANGNIIYYSTDTLDNFFIKKMDYMGNFEMFDTYGKEDVAVSPDGKTMVYYSFYEKEKYMGLLETQAPGDSIAITPRGVYSGRAHWSPDASKIAYISNRTGTNQLFLYDMVVNKSSQLTDSIGTKKYISWAPDGERIAFTIQYDEGPADIYIFGLEYGTIDRLTETPVNESEISWSPDGSRIAYHAEIEGEDDIYWIDLETQQISKVTKADGYHGEPQWIRVVSPVRLKP